MICYNNSFISLRNISNNQSLVGHILLNMAVDPNYFPVLSSKGQTFLWMSLVKLNSLFLSPVSTKSFITHN